MEGELRGLLLLHDDIREATIRGCRVRLVTGDYLAITQESALQRLLAWTALGTSPDEPDVGATTETDAPGFAARIVETARLDPPGSAFHPKAWLFEGPDLATAFVGSSNVSRSALAVGVEWNLRTDRASNPAAWERLRRAFEDLWASASLLTPEWVSAYALRAREAARTRARGAAPAPVPGEIVPDEAPDLFPPHRLQEAGLAALAKARGEQRGRCLVVMATGLGKTWLAAFDLATVAEELGRGLRRSEGKETLTVIDFVGNHRVFLDRLRLLLSFGRTGVSLRQFLVDDASPELPAGCSMEVELEAIEMLRFLVPRGESETARAYRELKAARGERPTAGELFRMGYTLPAGRWFPFVREEGDLDDSQANVLAAAEEWFADLQTTQMAKSYKLVLLEALLEAGTLSTGLRLDDLAARSYRILRRSPELAGDLEVASLDGLAGASDPRWLPYWKENPVRAWTEGPHRRWFKLEGDTFVPRLPVPEGLGDVFEAMTRELVDYRLAQYRRRSERMPSGGSFACKVLWNKRDPILKLPPRSQTAAVPAGERDVRLPDGSVWRFRFRNKSCYVAGPAGKDRNELPDLLRGWFGPNAGKPGTAFHVRFSAAPDGLWVEPERTATAEVLSFPSRTLVTSYPSLRAAAGAARRDSFGAFDEGPDSPGETVALPISRPTHRLFAARAIGSSMDGGPSPIRDGDWVVMRWARGEVPKNLFTTRKVVLVETAGSGGDGAYQLKRIVREDGKWLLRSDNPETPDFDATEETVPIAVLVETVRPEQLAPETGSLVSDDRLAEAFGLPERPSTGRVMGHLFLLAEERGPFVAPDRVSFPVVRRPGETVFVLARVSKDAPWRYCGTGRWHEQESAWDVPELDWGTWHALGAGRSASRRIPAGCEREAAALIARILEKAERGAGHFVREGRTIRVLGPTDRGGLRIDGGPGGFGERTVSKTDFAWVLAARRDVAANGGLLDEHRVNRLRYLEGTPYDSTRWIDTRTALQLLEP